MISIIFTFQQLPVIILSMPCCVTRLFIASLFLPHLYKSAHTEQSAGSINLQHKPWYIFLDAHTLFSLCSQLLHCLTSCLVTNLILPMLVLCCSEKGQLGINSPEAADEACKCFEGQERKKNQTPSNYFKRNMRLSLAFVCSAKWNSIICQKSSKFDSFWFSSYIIFDSNWKFMCLKSKYLSFYFEM